MCGGAAQFQRSPSGHRLDIGDAADAVSAEDSFGLRHVIMETLEGDPCYATELMQLKTRDENGESGDLAQRLRSDDLYEPAVEIVIREGRGSVSLLQRALGIGYGRAARLIDFMAEDGIVGAYNGANAREVKYTPEQWQAMRERIKTS